MHPLSIMASSGVTSTVDPLIQLIVSNVTIIALAGTVVRWLMKTIDELRRDLALAAVASKDMAVAQMTLATSTENLTGTVRDSIAVTREALKEMDHRGGGNNPRGRP